MGRNEYSRHRQCDPKSVAKAEADGRIAAAVKRDQGGRFLGIDWRLADDLWARHTDPVAAAKNNKSVLPPGPSGVEPLAEPGALGASADVYGFFAARAREKVADADLRELEKAQRYGLALRADEVREISARRYRAVRDQITNIPDRVAAELAAEKDPARVHARLSQEIERVLHQLADEAEADAERG